MKALKNHHFQVNIIGKVYKNFICINLGYGIGSGIITEGRMFDGVDGIAGEIGHVIADKQSKIKGREGIPGTLEALASGYGLADIAQDYAKKDRNSIICTLMPDDIDAKKIFDIAREGDILANRIIDSAVEHISIGIDTLIKLFNTECIVLSGGLVNNGEMFIDKIRKEVNLHSMSAITRSVPIVISDFNDNAALVGSFSLILEKILFLEVTRN